MAGYRNPFEARVGRMLGPDFTYEPFKLDYTLSCTYTPDFVDHEHKRIVEAKGELTVADRRKMIAVKAQHPDYSYEICFQNPRQKLSKKSPTTYRAWAEKHGFVVRDAPPRK